MKESKNNDSSRRDFIKTSAKIALGSTLVGGVAPQAGSQANQPTNSAPASPPPRAGKSAPHPGKLGDYFRGQMKLPGWLPDTTVNLYPEEAIHRDSDNGFDAFVPPNDKNPFENAVLILGSPFDKDPNKYTDFEKLLAEIAHSARRYNAALYWIRRLHFHLRAVSDVAFKINTAPPRNPNGDDDDPNHDVSKWKLPEFGDPNDPSSQPTRKAQDKWEQAVKDLNNSLTAPKHGFNQIWADMIQVNGYIVSIRLVADTNSTGGIGILEMGGSSSHISLSSAFSSP
jgi:hypothetical protein